MALVQTDLLANLNEQQRQAVLHRYGPALVVAGAGTGKTKVITTRIAHLISENLATPEQILALTFTDKAALEMEERVDRLLPYGYIDTQIMTFHALGAQILQDNSLVAGLPPSVSLASNLQQHIILREVLEALPKSALFRPVHNPGQYRELLLRYFSRLKDDGLDPRLLRRRLGIVKRVRGDEFSGEERAKYSEIASIYESYQEALHKQGFIDFGDQLMLSYQLLRNNQQLRAEYHNRYKFILVDEFQDTNTIQAKLLKVLCNNQQNIMAVGDDDQSIYRFRGAQLQNILNFQSDYKNTTLIVLSENYRSTQEIINTSYELIQHNNPDRLESRAGINKRLHAQDSGEMPQIVQLEDIHEEMSYIAHSIEQSINGGEAPESIAVICRNNNQAQEISQVLLHRGVQVASQSQKSLLHAAVVRQCLDFIRVLHDPDDSSALYRYLTSPRIGCDVRDVMRVSAVAYRMHVSLHKIITESTDKADSAMKNALLALEGYRQYSHNHSVGELLYFFISNDNYLNALVEEAHSNPGTAKDIQNLAVFFTMVKEFEMIQQNKDSFEFWRYIQEMYSTEILEETESIDPTDGVAVLTAHRAKGLEFKQVYIFDLTEGSFPATRKGEQLKDPFELQTSTQSHLGLSHEQEERRLCYVAMTRACRELILTYSLDHGGKRSRRISRFLLDAFGNDIKITSKVAKSLPASVLQFAPTQKVTMSLPSYPTTEDGWLELTPNQISDYVKDPSNFYVRHILKFPSAPSHYAIYGTAIHRALEYFYREQLERRRPKLKEMLALYSAGWRSEGFVSLRHEFERKTAGEATIRRIFRSASKQEFTVQAVEAPCVLELQDIKVRIRGRIDLVINDSEGGVEIRDFKTSHVSSIKTAQDKVRDTLPLHIYALAWERNEQQPVSCLSLHFVDDDIIAQRSKIDHKKTLLKIEEAARGIREGHFPKRGNQLNLEADGIDRT
ncbi:ATP-dependent helicase [Candidatus Saccharibacteria bacterium]|nr:ATP-dependent helicase [Candidatus Saccharibacteria bacterium]